MAAGVGLVQGYTYGRTVPYRIEFEESVLGLYPGSHVVYLGVPVGKVKDISVTEGNRAHVEIQVEPGKVTLHEGVTARLVLYSIATGALAVTLSGGDHNRPELAHGALIPTEPSLLQSVSGQMADLMTNVTQTAELLRSGLDGLEEGELTRDIRKIESLVEDTKDAVDSINETMGRVADRIEPSIDKYEQLAEELRVTAGNFNKFVSELRGKVEPVDFARLDENLNRVLKQSDNLLGRLGEIADSLDTTAQAALYDAENMGYQLRETLAKVNDALEAIREFVSYLQQDPSALVRGKGRLRGE